MTKVIENIELLKKLAPKIEEMETEYTYYNEYWYEHMVNLAHTTETEWDYWVSWELIWETKIYDKIKTLTVEEAIEFIWKQMCQINLIYPNAWVWMLHQTIWEEVFEWETLIEAFSKFIEYLIDNKLL